MRVVVTGCDGFIARNLRVRLHELGHRELTGITRATTAEEFSERGRELQEYMFKNMIYMSATSLPSLQAARDYVQGYVYERGFKVRFESTWLNK